MTDTTKRVVTESGAVYLLRPADKPTRIKRENPDAAKRADGEWLALYNHPEVEVGHVMVLLIEQLSPRGADDHGNVGSTAPHTTRITTPVVSIEDQ